MKTVEQIREGEARSKSAFFAGEADDHPHGLSGLRAILPYENEKGCWDTHPRGWQVSEWGNAAGIV